jgi:hypothetical protein
MQLGYAPSVRSVYIWLLSTACAISALGCSSDSCTLIGCSSAGLIAGEMSAPSGSVTLQACRNGACSKLEAVAAAGCHSSAQLYVCFAPAASGVRLDVTLYHDGHAPALADGDVYTLDVLEDSSGTSLVDFTGTASYNEYRPNGEGCDPVCKSAELAL